jgi:preprotein translocase subunit SecA
MPLEVIVESFGLVENTDYTIDETNKKIVLTEEGFNKFMAKV